MEALNDLKSKSGNVPPLKIEFYLLAGVFRPVYSLYTLTPCRYITLVSLIMLSWKIIIMTYRRIPS